MSEKKRVEGEPGFGEAEVAEILERAIKLDGARDTRVTVEQLREAALEVGVSPAAFTQALAEFGRAGTPAKEASVGEAPVSKVGSAIRTGLAVAFGATVGATAGIMDGPYPSEETGVLVAILLAGASLRLVLSHRKEKGLLPYILDVIWLWSSSLVALGFAANALAEEFIIVTMVGIVLASVVGGWIIKMTGKEEATEATRTLRLEIAAPEDKPNS
jgi:hypothetical protein